MHVIFRVRMHLTFRVCMHVIFRVCMHVTFGNITPLVSYSKVSFGLPDRFTYSV